MGQGTMGYGMMYGYGWPHILCGILLIAGIVLLAVWLFRQSGAKHTEQETALDILKKRYASGEIDKEEFERMKRELM
jgi:putative membrane protein